MKFSNIFLLSLVITALQAPSALFAQSEISIDARPAGQPGTAIRPGAPVTGSASGSVSAAGQLHGAHTDLPAPTIISRDIYGQFAEHLGHGVYEGLWVGLNSPIPNTRGIRNDVVAALKGAKIPLIRWPGGCFADEYHWMDGIGPAAKRPTMINTNWGGVTEDNSFGTHEFMDLCEQVGCDAYISGNLGSGTVRELSQWVEYLTSPGKSPMTDLRKENGRDKPWKIKYLGLGNEAWGCGGDMTPAYYADEMRKYGSYVKIYPGSHLQKIASGASDFDFNWTETVMKQGAHMLSGVSLHYYTIEDGWDKKGSATDFSEADWFKTMQKTLEMDSLVAGHSAIMDKYDPEKKVGLMVDEWGNWFDVEKGTNPGFLFQQNSLRDALVAGVNLNIFNNHSDRVRMTCIAQMVNVLQALILTKGKELVLTPTYYVYQMYAAHQDAELLKSTITSARYMYSGKSLAALNVSASRDKSGHIHVTICNINPAAGMPLKLNFSGIDKLTGVSAQVLSAPKITDFNEFGKKPVVTPAAFTAFHVQKNKVELTVPARSVLELEFAAGM